MSWDTLPTHALALCPLSLLFPYLPTYITRTHSIMVQDKIPQEYLSGFSERSPHVGVVVHPVVARVVRLFNYCSHSQTCGHRSCALSAYAYIYAHHCCCCFCCRVCCTHLLVCFDSGLRKQATFIIPGAVHCCALWLARLASPCGCCGICFWH